MATSADMLAISGLQFALLPAHTAHMWSESNAGANPGGITNPVADGAVAQIDEPAGGWDINTTTDVTRPLLKSDGTDAFLRFDGSNDKLVVDNSKGLRCFHYQPQSWLILKIRPSAQSAAQRMIFGTNDISNATTGLAVWLNSDGKLYVNIGSAATGLSIFTGTYLTSAAALTNQWYTVVVKLDYAGNTASMTINGGTPVTGTFVSTGQNVDTSANWNIGGNQSNTKYFNGDIKLILAGSGTLSAGDITNATAYDPAITTTSLAVATNNANSIASTDVPFLWLDYDFTTKTNLWKASDKAVQVTAGGDTVGYVINSKPIISGSSWNRDATQATAGSRPTYEVNQFGSVGAVYFDGDATDPEGGNFTGENALAMATTTPRNGSTIIAFYKNLRASAGSHIMCTPLSRYIVQTGSTYTGSTYGWVVLHTYGTAYDSPRPTDPEGANAWWVRHEGANGTQYMNGVAGTASTTDGGGAYSYIGRAAHASGGNTWDMYGPIARIIVYNAALPVSAIQRIVNTVATQLGMTAAYRSRTSGSAGFGFGFGFRI